MRIETTRFTTSRSLPSPSHLSQVCGLKLHANLSLPPIPWSHLSQVCGLKHRFPVRNDLTCWVTPLAGVRIETLCRIPWRMQTSVTPLAGVRIETFTCFTWFYVNRSHLSQVCGLKLGNILDTQKKAKSHLSQVCGLKLEVWADQYHAISHTSRRCAD